MYLLFLIEVQIFVSIAFKKGAYLRLLKEIGIRVRLYLSIQLSVSVSITTAGEVVLCFCDRYGNFVLLTSMFVCCVLVLYIPPVIEWCTYYYRSFCVDAIRYYWKNTDRCSVWVDSETWNQNLNIKPILMNIINNNWFTKNKLKSLYALKTNQK